MHQCQESWWSIAVSYSGTAAEAYDEFFENHKEIRSYAILCHSCGLVLGLGGKSLWEFSKPMTNEGNKNHILPPQKRYPSLRRSGSHHQRVVEGVQFPQKSSSKCFVGTLA
jgi:hypothetical protein